MPPILFNKARGMAGFLHGLRAYPLGVSVALATSPPVFPCPPHPLTSLSPGARLSKQAVKLSVEPNRPTLVKGRVVLN